MPVTQIVIRMLAFVVVSAEAALGCQFSRQYVCSYNRFYNRHTVYIHILFLLCFYILERRQRRDSSLSGLTARLDCNISSACNTHKIVSIFICEYNCSSRRRRSYRTSAKYYLKSWFRGNYAIRRDAC